MIKFDCENSNQVQTGITRTLLPELLTILKCSLCPSSFYFSVERTLMPKNVF
jgi:hypothetical protein